MWEKEEEVVYEDIFYLLCCLNVPLLGTVLLLCFSNVV